MRVITVHNTYQQRGGEDVVVEAELKLLADNSVDVTPFVTSNHSINNVRSVKLAASTVWSAQSKSCLKEEIGKHRPDIVHFHNTFPLISPAAYYAAREEGVPVVQTLHNYRLLCPNALLFRNGGVCEDCLDKLAPWPGVIHSCYRNSRAASGTVASMLSFHRVLRTWKDAVDIYIALTDFAKAKFIEGGLPADKVVVKPNFIHPDPGVGTRSDGYALFVGRLSEEKGIDTLLAAWEQISKKLPLKIVGDGPLAQRVSDSAERLDNVEWLGNLEKENVTELMKKALFLVFPSLWYEGFPMVIAEAYAAGIPVVASNTGSMKSIIDHGRTGLHFRTGYPGDLADKVMELARNTSLLAKTREQARAEFKCKYTAEVNYSMLMAIYERAINGSRYETKRYGY